jgi:hypothetical protein
MIVVFQRCFEIKLSTYPCTQHHAHVAEKFLTKDRSYAAISCRVEQKWSEVTKPSVAQQADTSIA